MDQVMIDVDRVAGVLVECTQELVAKKLEPIEAAAIALAAEVTALDEVALGEIEALAARLSALEDEVARLRSEAAEQQ